MLTWERWAPGGGVEQPRSSLDAVAAGAHDDDVRSYAGRVRDWGGTLAAVRAVNAAGTSEPASTAVRTK